MLQCSRRRIAAKGDTTLLYPLYYFKKFKRHKISKILNKKQLSISITILTIELFEFNLLLYTVFQKKNFKKKA